MLVLLSSGATRRYRDDIIRALALPAGSDLQFRYDRRYIDPSLLKRIEAGGVQNEEAIVLYLWSDKEKAYTEIVPCRMVKVVSAEFAGSSCIVRLRAGNFVSGLDDPKFKTCLSAEERTLLPTWESKVGVGPVLNGKFFFSIKDGLSNHATEDIAAFEGAAISLARFKDFSDPQSSTLFYTVRRVIKFGFGDNDPSRARSFKPNAGSYELYSGEHYETEIYTFVPPGVELKSAELHIDSDVDAVEFPLGNRRDINSRYDLKRVSFQIPEQVQAVSAGIHLYITDPGDQASRRSDILLPIRFTGSLQFAIARIVLIGLGASGSGIVAANAAGKLNFGNAVLMIFLGLVAAIGTVFTSLKK